MNLLECKQLMLQRGGCILFADFSTAVVAGRVTVIMGPNGTGKSSLLLALAGMIPVSGEMILQGRLLNEYTKVEIAREIAWQGDLPPTEFGLTVAQRLQLVAGENDTDFGKPASLMEVDELMNRTLGELSSGERQRVELAALMLRDCPIWLLDEPTAHLDLRHQVVCLNMLRHQAEQGRAVVVVLHDIQQAISIADDVILLDGHRHIETGDALAMLTREHLQTVFDIPLHEESLLPEYQEAGYESAR